MKDIFKKFDSITAFNTYLKNSEVQPAFARAECSHDISDHKTDWTGSVSYPAATNLMLYGDHELQKKIERTGVADVRTNIYKSMTRKQMYSSVVGAAPNVPAYISGAPNSMIAIRQTKVRQRVVNVAYNCAVCGAVDSQNIIDGCTRLISALMLIEAKGIRVNLYLVSLGGCKKQSVSFSIKIKSAGQHFDTLKMAYPMAHPSMNRRHKFRFFEVTEGVSTELVWGYGCAETNDEKAKIFFEKHGQKFDCVLNNDSLSYVPVERIIEKITGK